MFMAVSLLLQGRFFPYLSRVSADVLDSQNRVMHAEREDRFILRYVYREKRKKTTKKLLVS